MITTVKSTREGWLPLIYPGSLPVLGGLTFHPVYCVYFAVFEECDGIVLGGFLV